MLSDQIRQARERAGLSIYALAQKTGVGVASISEIESGKNKNPGLLTVTKLADVLNVSLDTLAERTPAPAHATPAPAKRPHRRQATGKAAADPDAGAFCPECGVGDGMHQLDCSVVDARVANDPEAQENLRRGRMLTAKLLEIAGQAAPTPARRPARRRAAAAEEGR